MTRVSVLGIDLAKRVFQLHGVDERGNAILRRKVSRRELRQVLSTLQPCRVAMEASSGAHFWARQFIAMGHEVKLIAPQFVKPFVKSNKNDRNDAEAICEAAQRPSMRFVAVKQPFHQDVQSLHRVRHRMVKAKTALVQELHGLLHEYGFVLPSKAPAPFVRRVREIIDGNEGELSGEMKALLRIMLEELDQAKARIGELNRRVKQLCESNDTCRRLHEMPGVGPLVATAMVAAVADPTVFRNGRQMSAWLGLVPRQNSSGGKEKLLGISKRGDCYLRWLVIHGARTVVYHAEHKTDRLSRWVVAKEKTRGRNRTVVAVANRNVRAMWAIMNRNERYRMEA